MPKFDMITWADEKYRKQAYDINNQYFTIDTAEPEDVYDWVNHNRLMVTYALNNDRVDGFFNVMPLTQEAGQAFERNEIKEEEITTDEILGPHVMQYAEYLYFPAIAVRNYQSYNAHQCTAALMSALASLLLNIYDPQKLKKIFVNPTTFQGNRMIRKLGLEPLKHYKKVLTGNDIYLANFTENTFKKLSEIEQRYARFVGHNCWHEKEWLSKL
jgi:hypothetical protein